MPIPRTRAAAVTEELRRLIQTRLALEPLATEMAARNMNDRDARRIAAAHVRLTASVKPHFAGPG
jgi:DNA-binding GntR family transcriptional regulator